MVVYRITTAKWANKLSGSGYPARWNPRYVHIIYTASSIALACLENLVHRSGEGLNANFRVVEINIPNEVTSKEITPEELPDNWYTINGYSACQSIGRRWVDEQRSCTMFVPSSIIPAETNVLINPNHPEFHQISIRSIREFSFDKRLIPDEE